MIKIEESSLRKLEDFIKSEEDLKFLMKDKMFIDDLLLDIGRAMERENERIAKQPIKTADQYREELIEVKKVLNERLIEIDKTILELSARIDQLLKENRSIVKPRVVDLDISL